MTFVPCFPPTQLTVRLCLGLACACGLLVQADDWPQYRGPNHDGISTELIRTNWDVPPEVVWRRPLDPGLGSFAVENGRLYTTVNRLDTSDGKQKEWCVAMDAADGTELWATPLDQADYPSGGVGNDDGPRSTPAVSGTNVYVYTSYLILACLNGDSGDVVWKHDFRSNPAYASSTINWQNAASPLVDGDLVFVNCNSSSGRIAAFRCSDGHEMWRGFTEDRLTHATPVLATIAGVRQLVFFTNPNLVGVRPETGAELWRYRITTANSSSMAASPVVGSNIVYFSASYATGAGGVAISTNTSGALAATQKWKLQVGGIMNHWSTPVHHNGYLYGIYGDWPTGILKCVDLATGLQVVDWGGPDIDSGGILKVGDHLLVITSNGRLILLALDPTAYREIAPPFPVVTSGKCWNVPAISNGRIYIRSTLQAVCLDVSAAPPPLQVATNTLPGAVEGLAYSSQLQATGGTPPYTWSLAPESDPLPNGLTLSLEGSINGTPKESGFFPLVVRVTDSAETTADQVLELNISDLHIEILVPPQTTTNIQQDGFRFQFSATVPGTYFVDWSTNLVDWTKLGPMEYTDSPIEVHDTTATAEAFRFYRVRR